MVCGLATRGSVIRAVRGLEAMREGCGDLPSGYHISRATKHPNPSRAKGRPAAESGTVEAFSSKNLMYFHSTYAWVAFEI